MQAGCEMKVKYLMFVHAVGCVSLLVHFYIVLRESLCRHWCVRRAPRQQWISLWSQTRVGDTQRKERSWCLTKSVLVGAAN